MHIVPVPIYEPLDFHPALTNLDLNPWIRIQKPIEAWVENLDYALYSHYPMANNATLPTCYIIIHEPQDVTTSLQNEFVHILTQAHPTLNAPGW